MNRILCAFVIAVPLSVPAVAQVRNSRTSDYLFLTAASDVRATWVNPAGLAAVPEASVMGEIVLGGLADGEQRLDQVSVGFNSRGFSVAYQRDRFEGAPSSNIVRFSTGLPFPRGSIGFGVSWYGVEGPNRRDFDVGLVYRPLSIMALGATLKHIGRPDLAGIKQPLIADGGGGVALLSGRIFAAGEAKAIERLGASGWDVSYRGGFYVLIPTRRPISLIAVADFNSDFDPNRFNFGIAIGGRNSVTAVATLLDGLDGIEFDRVSVAGVASNVLGGR